MTKHLYPTEEIQSRDRKGLQERQCAPRTKKNTNDHFTNTPTLAFLEAIIVSVSH